MNKKFGELFSVLLEQDLNNKEPALTDKEAMKTTLDKGSNPEDFDVNMDPNTDPSSSNDAALAASQQLADTITAQNGVMINQLKDWISRIDEFVDFLNSTEGDSIQVALAKSIPDTLFDKIRIAESKKISRSAVDLAALSETFKSYVTNSLDPKYRYS